MQRRDFLTTTALASAGLISSRRAAAAEEGVAKLATVAPDGTP